MQESLEKATHSAGFLISELMEALAKSNSVEGIIILGLVKKSADLKNEINALLNAHAMDHPTPDCKQLPRGGRGK